ncbi:tetratricopeptide repeat protein [Catenovulum sp. 2E275]|uniref:tetratricopeptide repeat protein n=1 Tax=Catenovulum sp. 2E275 TaxID=2980497 RepID=UPI0021D3A904|nr:tetratricopeptide repeat protein [Catenovulum sp. 2E275]MCU4676151.1 tetratricopeptide repeat protein [Catenovulum sp. 2E275]
MHSPVYSQLDLLRSVLPPQEVEQAEIKFHQISVDLQAEIAGLNHPVDKVQAILDFFYFEQIFCLSVNQPHDVGYNLATGLLYHCAATPVLAVILVDLLRQADLEAEPIMAKQGAIVRIRLADNQFVFIKADDGASFDWHEVELHLGLTEKDQEKIKGPSDLTIADDKEIDALLLNLFKAELIELGMFDHAFQVSQTLLELDPDNPYERRDRGFLLQQMDCDKLAVADYQFFIEQCPKDPMAQILKNQLSSMENHRRDIH